MADKQLPWKIKLIKDELFRRSLNRIGEEYDEIRRKSTQDLERDLEKLELLDYLKSKEIKGGTE